MPLLDLELYRKEVTVSDNPLVRLSVIDAGRSPAERTLLFVHGFGGYAMQWEQQLIEFADKHRVVAIDLRGTDCPTNRIANMISTNWSAILNELSTLCISRQNLFCWVIRLAARLLPSTRSGILSGLTAWCW